MKRQPGFVGYIGPSLLGDGMVIVAFTSSSINEKTGPMWQAWVLREDIAPLPAVASGADRAICGDCAHRSGVEGIEGRTCYVSLFAGPRGVWDAYRKGNYRHLADPRDVSLALRGQHVRVAAYGDPAALPFEYWAQALARVAGWVGYTHQWAACDSRFARLLMASVDSEAEAEQAHALGWRTYRARAHGAPLRPDEFMCPASDEAGHRVTCLRCQLCRGLSSPAKSVAIELHGHRFKTASGAVAVRRRDDLWWIRDQLALGQHVALPKQSQRSLSRTLLALRLFYRRHKLPWSVRQRRTDSGFLLRLEKGKRPWER